MRAFKYKVGDRKGRWLIVSYLGKRKYGHHYWKCRCDCGAERVVTTSHLSNTVSCGCYLRDSHTTHGMSRTPTYGTWISMIRRCYDKRHDSYERYGARGIRVCERWKSSFASFFADMGERPIGMTLDRIDNDLDYEAGNCRWGTAIEQNNNRRNTPFFTYHGRTQSLADWAREIGIPHRIAHWRLTHGWSIEKVVSVGYTPRSVDAQSGEGP
jgi:hypothetical protein